MSLRLIALRTHYKCFFNSQAVDVAGLKATSIQNIITICTVLGFLAHGYVTDEFEVTEERLGVYLPVSKTRQVSVKLLTRRHADRAY